MDFCVLKPEHEGPLANFFAALVAEGADRQFHPHAFSADTAHQLSRYTGKDKYLVAIADGTIHAYGLLRGWDQGYARPSLGIAVRQSSRGTGLAKAFMIYLHLIARLQGADSVRLKVYPDNIRAKRLYESLGYRFEGRDHDQDVGVSMLR